MTTRSKKIQDILFGNVTQLEGGLPVRANFSYPIPNGQYKTVYWRGNEGLIIHLIERIETLEKELGNIKDKRVSKKEKLTNKDK